MPITIKTGSLKFKDPDTGKYVGIDVAAETKASQQLASIEAAGEAQVASITQNGEAQMADITENGESQMADITQNGQSQVAAIQTAGQTQVSNIETKGAETLDSIPDDYTDLYNDVGVLKSAVDELEEITLAENSETVTTSTTLTLADGFLGETGQLYTGDTYNNFGYTADAISVLPGDIIRIYTAANVEQTSIKVLIAYNGATLKEGARDKALPYTVPADVDGIKISAANALKTAGVKMTITRTVTVKVPALLSRVEAVEDAIDNTVSKTGIDQVTAQNLVIIDETPSPNLFDLESAQNGKAMQKDGTVIDASFYLSDFIPVIAGETYIYTVSQNGSAQNYGEIRYLACFDESKTIMPSAGSDTANARPFVIPDDVAYVKISVSNLDSVTNRMFSKNKYVTPYQSAAPIQKVDTKYIPNYDEMSEAFRRVNSGIFDRIGNIRTTAFNSDTLPEGWSNSGFILSASGASPAAEGDLLQYVQYSDLDSSCVTVTIDASTAFDLFIVRYRRQYSAQGGRVIEFDMTSKTINVYMPTTVSETPTNIAETFTIPFDFVAGQYTLTISNCAEIEKYTIFGAGQCAEFYCDGRVMDRLTVGNTLKEAWSRPHDNYGVQHKSGTYAVKMVTFSSPLACEPDVLVVGDSICEGDTIRKLDGGGFENRWVGLLSNVTLVSLWAEGGNNSTHINNDLSMLTTLFRPKKVIYAVGVNDSTYSTWLANCQAFTTAFEAVGAEVIYATPVLRSAYEANSLEQQRAWIKASGHRYIDFCAAMSVDGECEEVNTELFLSDELHPNVEGHKHMFDAVINTLPDLMMY